MRRSSPASRAPPPRSFGELGWCVIGSFRMRRCSILVSKGGDLDCVTSSCACGGEKSVANPTKSKAAPSVAIQSLSNFFRAATFGVWVLVGSGGSVCPRGWFGGGARVSLQRTAGVCRATLGAAVGLGVIGAGSLPASSLAKTSLSSHA